MAIYGRASSAKAGWNSAIESVNAQVEEKGVTMRQFGKIPDALDILPDAVRGKLVQLRETAENCTAAYRSLDEAFRHLQLEKVGAETRLLQLTDAAAGMRSGYRHVLRPAVRSRPRDHRLQRHGAPARGAGRPAESIDSRGGHR